VQRLRHSAAKGNTNLKKGDLHHSANFALLVPRQPDWTSGVMTYDELVELAGLCSRNSRITTSKEVATELWRMAREYQTQAAKLGAFPEIGDEPPL
jgi:hypothetical protein